jgi:hypothetical protein
MIEGKWWNFKRSAGKSRKASPRNPSPGFSPKIPGWFLLVLSLALPLASHCFQSDIGLPSPDEGYLWYGSIQASSGEIPIRDFESNYNPGRYYWSGLFLRLHPGILSFRFSLAVFLAFSLFCGLWVLKRGSLRAMEILSMAFALTLWSTQRHRVFEYGFPMMAIAALFWTGEKPSSLSRWFIAGLFTGFSAFFGRNLGLYHLGAFLAFFSWNLWKGNLQKPFQLLAAFGTGILTGFSPFIAMTLLLPGFGERFFEEIKNYFFWKTTNPHWPAPWIWDWRWIPGRWGSSWMTLMNSVFFLAPPFFYGYCLFLYVRRIKQAGLGKVPLAASCVGLFYFHYAFSRPDPEHIAASMAPFLIGLAAIFSSHRRRSWVVFLILALSVGYAGEQSYAFRFHLLPPFLRSTLLVGGDNLKVRADSAASLESLRSFLKENMKPGEEVWAAPDFPQLYPLLGRPCPTWESYFVMPSPLEWQRNAIQELASRHVIWLVLRNSTLQNPQGSTFQQTDPLLWDYLMKNFRQVTGGDLQERFQIFKKTDPG